MTAPVRKPEPIANAFSGWLARDEKGAPITRKRQCICGREYVQSMLNPSFIDANPKLAAEFVKQIPDGYVPVWCPSCESKDLGSIANRRSYMLPTKERP